MSASSVGRFQSWLACDGVPRQTSPLPTMSALGMGSGHSRGGPSARLFQALKSKDEGDDE